MMLGFTIPLLIVLGAESIVALMLLGPRALNKPAIDLAKATYTPYGQTIVNTVAAVLLLLLASPAYDAFRIYRATNLKDEGHFDPNLSINEATTTLSLVLTLGALGLMYVLRKLGKTLGDNERMAASEAALLKQVKGLQSEYSRVVEGGAAAAPAGSAAHEAQEALQRKLAAAEERAAAAEKAQSKAESNLAALKAQAGGLEKEYDRLLAEHDRLRRQLGQATGVPAGAPMAKKDE